jgi:hypothetical protein
LEQRRFHLEQSDKFVLDLVMVSRGIRSASPREGSLISMVFRGACAALLVVALAGCVPEVGSRPPNERVGATPATTGLTPVTSESQLVLPLDRYQTTVDEWRLIMDSQQHARVECMGRFGLETRPERFEPDLYEDVYDSGHLRYGLFDREAVEENGYGSGESSLVDDAIEIPITDDVRRFKELLLGTDAVGNPVAAVDVSGVPLPKGGCNAEVQQRLTDGVTADAAFLDLPNKLSSEAQEELLSSQEFAALEAEWSECMAESGYEFVHRWDAEESVLRESPARQREMALEDLECGERTNFVARMMSLDAAIQERLIAENEASLRGALEMKRKLLENAKELFR